MNCGGARRLFGAYWDDEITLAERDWLESHFSACDGCRLEYEQFARSIELVGSLPRAEVRPDLAERALARARRATAAVDRLPQGTPRWIPVTATAALLAIAATMTLQWIGVTPSGRKAERSSTASLAEPELVRPAHVQRPAPLSAEPDAADMAGALAGGAADTLFDHSADVEFILDPVMLKKGRAHTVLKLNPSVQGEKAVITF
jgi:putative zinc finger protein